MNIALILTFIDFWFDERPQIVDGDPLADVTVLRGAWGVMRNGQLHTPAEWMDQGTSP